ncbi:MAG: GNAT family N-acetyltransferase [Actinobacteria bacterium]|nr:GNAT family N-acetyltransferase [Actinomycetota bacterium]
MPPQPPGTQLVGERVSIRLHDPEGGFRDIVGILESETSLRKRSGNLVEFSPQDIAAWRLVAPAQRGAGKGAPLSLRIREMEIAAAQTWPAAVQEQLGDWTMRATGKFTMRANSVLVLGEPQIELDEALARVNTFYSSHGLPSVIHVPLPTFQTLDNALDQKGWEVKTEALVMVADIGSFSVDERTDYEWSLTETFDQAWLDLQNDSGVREIMRSAPAVYASLRIDGVLVAVGRAANFGDWTVLTRLFVHPKYRRQRIGTELISRLLNEATRGGAAKALLQVDVNNQSAIQAYEKYGFRKHHSYRYRVAPTEVIALQADRDQRTFSGGC